MTSAVFSMLGDDEVLICLFQHLMPKLALLTRSQTTLAFPAASRARSGLTWRLTKSVNNSR